MARLLSIAVAVSPALAEPAEPEHTIHLDGHCYVLHFPDYYTELKPDEDGHLVFYSQEADVIFSVGSVKKQTFDRFVANTESRKIAPVAPTKYAEAHLVNGAYYGTLTYEHDVQTFVCAADPEERPLCVYPLDSGTTEPTSAAKAVIKSIGSDFEAGNLLRLNACKLGGDELEAWTPA